MLIEVIKIHVLLIRIYQNILSIYCKVLSVTDANLFPIPIWGFWNVIHKTSTGKCSKGTNRVPLFSLNVNKILYYYSQLWQFSPFVPHNIFFPFPYFFINLVLIFILFEDAIITDPTFLFMFHDYRSHVGVIGIWVGFNLSPKIFFDNFNNLISIVYKTKLTYIKLIYKSSLMYI